MDPGTTIGAVGLVLQFFDLGKTAFKLLSSMEDVSGDARTLRILMKVERQRYENWAKEAGLESDNPVIFAEEHKGRYTAINIAIEIIAEICDLLTGVNSLEKRYGLQSHGQAADPDDAALAAQKIFLANGAAVLWSQQERSKREENLMALQKRLSHLQRLRWVIRDKGKLEELIEQLSKLNDGLRDILPPVLRNNYDRTLLIDQPDDQSILKLLFSDEAFQLASQDYVRAAKIKYLTMQQEGRAASSPVGLAPAVELDPRAVQPDSRDEARGLATFEGKKVIFEIKNTEETDRRILDIIDERVKGLVSLLQISPKPANFRVLDCKGYLKAPSGPASSTSYSLVFALPPELESRAGLRVQTLQSLLRRAGDNKVPVRYPLDARFRLAARLASSVLELHAAKWLHHNVTSANVVLLCPQGGKDGDALTQAYLCGFDLARFDDPREVSEIAARDGDNTYRHPDYQAATGGGASARKYRRSYELYSLGVVLAEIGLWRRAETLRPANSHAGAFARHLCDTVVPMLAYYMGQGYADAVMCCLDAKRLVAEGDEERRLSEAFSRKVVAVLEGCRA